MSSSARSEFAAAWPVLLAAALAVGVGSMGIGFYSLGLFIKPLQEEYGWSRAAVAGGATFQQLGIFASAPFVGWLLDRFGARRVATTSFSLAPLALLALTRVGSPVWQWYAGWLLLSIVGCGTTPVLWGRIVAQRFDRGRGLALGLMLTGSGVAALLAPAVFGPFIRDHGWRATMLLMAVVTLAGGLAACACLGRRTDHVPNGQAEVAGRFEINRATLTLVVVALLLGAIVAALIVHLVAMLIDRGVQPAAAAQVAAAVGLAVLASRVAVGWLFDRFHAPFVAALFLMAPVVACVLLRAGGSATLSALLLGLAAGAEVDMLAYFTSRYVRLANFGTTYGRILALFCLGAACGPPVFGWSLDRTNNYDLALGVAALLLLIVVFLIATLGRHSA